MFLYSNTKNVSSVQYQHLVTYSMDNMATSEQSHVTSEIKLEQAVDSTIQGFYDSLHNFFY